MKLLEMATPRSLFILGLLTLPAVLFQEKLVFRLLDGLLFLLLAQRAGKRILPLPALLLLASVTAAALLVPTGRVLITIFGLPVTEGALHLGFSRGVLLLGLFYLSKFTVVRGLVLPGRTGHGLARVLFYFERFSENYHRISIRDLPGSLDTLLLEISRDPADLDKKGRSGESRPMPLVIPLAVSIACWLFLLL